MIRIRRLEVLKKFTKVGKWCRNMGEKLYTAGELAKLAGVSLRTIRFYDVKGLLKPVGYSEAGYRHYNQASVERLQRILMLKYLGFSLEKIEELLQDDTNDGEWLAQQKELLRTRKRRLEEMITTIEFMEKEDSKEHWGYLLRLLNLLTEEEKIKEQYVRADNLEKRIRLHQRYSTATVDWTYWVFERFQLQEGQRVLELGCGNGSLWCGNVHNLPTGIHLTLSDRSEGMLDQTRENLAKVASELQERKIQVDFAVMDANELQLEPGSFDCIIANHMLYHVENKESCFREVARALKPHGIFCCATNGNGHMKEVHEMVAAFDDRIDMPFMGITSSFRLENGEEQLRPFFSKVQCDRQDNALIVDEADAIYDYVYSYPGNAPYILDQRGGEFKRMLEERIEKEGSIYIRKDCGMFVCEK